MTHRVDASYPVPGQYISSLKPRSKSRKWGKDAERAKNTKDLAQMRLSNLKSDILKSLPSMDKCLNAKHIFEKEINLHYVHFILEL